MMIIKFIYDHILGRSLILGCTYNFGLNFLHSLLLF